MKASALAGLALVVVLVLFIGPGGTAVADPPPRETGIGAQAILGTAFTYEGFLKQAGNPVTGACDLRSILYDADIGGNQVGSILTTSNMSVSGGLFTVPLDFGAAAFNGQARWLETAVRCPAGSGEFTPVVPRQALTATPYALYALGSASASAAPWSGLTGVPAGFTDGVDNDSGGTITGVTAGTGLTGGGTSGVVPLTVTGAPWSGLTGVPAGFVDGVDDAGWSLAGNAGTSPGNFLGTTDNVTLTLAVSGTAALRLEPNATSPNVIGGSSGNGLSPGVFGATIGGGGMTGFPNTVTEPFGTVGGGRGNRASGFVSPGDSGDATVGGGAGNTASGRSSTVGGGELNTASGRGATVGGGGLEGPNTASGSLSTVGGGQFNTASGALTTVAGGVQNTASFNFATVGGGTTNTASGSVATVGGGALNTASGGAATVGGGSGNTATATGATVPGGRNNSATGQDSFAAGEGAKANHLGSFVWADTFGADVNSPANGTFIVRANGGVWFGQAFTPITPTIGAGVFISTSTGGFLSTGGVWTDGSDRSMKAAFDPVDGGEVLAKVAGLPIATWYYQAEDPSIRHMGPMAQDFYAAFGLGAGDRHIASLDTGGVALAAIQGLYQLLQQKEARIGQLQQQSEARIGELEARLTALEAQLGTPQPVGADLVSTRPAPPLDKSPGGGGP